MSKLYDLLNTVIGKLNKAVKTEAQTLTDEQKAQARENIGALSDTNILTVTGVDADGNTHTYIVYGEEQAGGANEPE